MELIISEEVKIEKEIPEHYRGYSPETISICLKASLNSMVDFPEKYIFDNGQKSE